MANLGQKVSQLFKKSRKPSGGPVPLSKKASAVGKFLAGGPQAAFISFAAPRWTGRSYDTLFYIYAEDPMLIGGNVTYLSTTTRTDVTAGDNRIYIGEVTTPANGGSSTTGSGGGGTVGGGVGGTIE